MKKVYGLNYIRGVCALLVMLYHYTTRYYDIVYNMSAEKNHIGLWWGCWAVSAFFILSAFLTVNNIEDNTSLSGFLKKRAVRLYPTYWVAIILTVLVTQLADSKLKVGFPIAIANFTMLQGFVGIPNVDGAYWTLRYELWFYILIAITLLSSKRKYNVLSTAWLCLILFSKFLFERLGLDNTITGISEMALLSEWAHIFIIGISLSQILKNKKDILSYFNLLLSFIIEYSTGSAGRFLFVLVITLLCFISAVTHYRFKYDRSLNFLAGVSYPLYLIHQNIGYVIIGGFEKMGLRAGTGVVTAVAVSVLLAYLVHRFVEIPAMALVKNKK